MKAEVAEVFVLTAFWAIVTASLRLVFTFENISSLIVVLSGIDPVTFPRLELGRLPCCFVIVPDDALEGGVEEDDWFAVCAWAVLIEEVKEVYVIMIAATDKTSNK